MNPSSDPQLMLDLGKNYVVERIESRWVRKGQLEYLIKCPDFDNSDSSWEKTEVMNCQELIEEIETRKQTQTQQKSLETVATVAVIWI